MSDTPAIDGVCDPRFVRVRDAFAENFRLHYEVGATVAASVDGAPVVDLWGGWTDATRARAWRRDTLVNVFSAAKPLAAVAVLSLAERGAIDLDLPVARYWPEFAAAGKDTVTVRMLLSHRAGLPAIRPPLPPLAMYDWSCMTAALASETPWWEPGRAHGYHVNTFGFLAGELVRRASGDSVGTFVRGAITGPLGADLHVGLAPQHERRAAVYLFPPGIATIAEALFDAEAGDDADRRHFLRRVYFNPPGISGFGTVDTPAWRAAEMPSTNGYGNARALVRFYEALLGTAGARLLQPETLDEAIRDAAAGPDVVLGRLSRFGLGFQLSAPEHPFGPNARSFGHYGAGGSVGFADPDRRLAFAYTTNRPGPRRRNPRPRALIDAVYASF